MGDFAYVKDGVTHVAQLPSAREEVVPGVCWDDPCALFSPAYWHTQYLMTRCLGPGEPTFRIATTFEEELTACVLGGHGIPAEVALAAFAHLREAGLIANLCADEVRIENELAKPIKLGERHVRYRFFAQKARYLAAIYKELESRRLCMNNAVELRDELVSLPGIGPKTASFIVRNWLGSNEVAILDIHIVRAGILAGLYSKRDSVQTHYKSMETRFVTFARGLDVPTASLDVLMWVTMRQTPRLVRKMLANVR